MWALSWWPHAISHGINPFVTHYLWSPTGVNVAQGAYSTWLGRHDFLALGFPLPFNAQPTVGQLVADSPPSAPALKAFIMEHYVSHVVVDSAAAGPWPGVLAQRGLHGRPVGGVILYTVPRAPA
jgi:hypothetical protein